MDPKYKTKADQDDTFKNAREAAQATLDILKTEANEKEASVKKILEAMITVRHIKHHILTGSSTHNKLVPR